MAVRPIDRESLLRELTCDFTGTPFHGNRKVTIGEVRRIIESIPTLTQPNEPLTLEELREMTGQPFWDDAGSVWWIVAHVEGSKIYTEEGAILDFYEEGEEDVYFRRPPEGEGNA